MPRTKKPSVDMRTVFHGPCPTCGYDASVHDGGTTTKGRPCPSCRTVAAKARPWTREETARLIDAASAILDLWPAWFNYLAIAEKERGRFLELLNAVDRRDGDDDGD